MFKHSVKVPRLYKVAAKVAKEVKEGIGSIKQLVYENRSKHPNIKAIYALVATLFQRSDEVENLLKRSQLLIKEPRLDAWLTKVLIVELLWGKKSLPGDSKPEKTVLAYEQTFKAHMSDGLLAVEENESDTKDDLKPRYVRVNTLKISLNEAVDGFRDEGWVLSKFLENTDYDKFLEKITSLTEEEFLIDIHIPDLLVFPPRTQFYDHPAYKNGSILLQDKASCLPVHILGPPPGSVVLDMCSAPGMKTTQVAALMKDQGKVYAVERDPRRFETLNRIIETSGATCISTVNKDVLTCNQKEFPGVQYILVDPSCSGSGIMGRMEFEQAKSNERIEKLAGFQIKILRAALTRYPDAKRVVYSTCSVFPEENEDVVRQVLETNSTFKLVPATKFVKDAWKNFGSSEYGILGSYCLYAKPNKDFTNGFFVAVLERLEEGEENQFFNTKIYNFKKHLQSQEKRKQRQQRMIKNGNKDDSKQSQNHEQDVNDDIEAGVNELKGEMDFVAKANHNVKRKKRKNKQTDEAKVEDSSFIKVEDEMHDRNDSKKKKKRDVVDLQSLEVGNIVTDSINIEKDDVKVADNNNANQNKRKKKHYTDLEADSTGNILKIEKDKDGTLDDGSVKKKKKKRKSDAADQFLETYNVPDAIIKLEDDKIGAVDDESVSKKKNKRKREVVEDIDSLEVDNITTDIVKTEICDIKMENEDIHRKVKKSKKKKDKDSFLIDNSVGNIDEIEIKEENKKIKKKKQHKSI